MTSNLNLIIASLLLIIIIIFKIIIIHKHKVNKNKTLYQYTKRLIIASIIISIVVFASSLLINISNSTTSLDDTITSLINAFSISLITFPISLITLYHTSFQDEEQISHIKTIITNNFDSTLIRKFNKAGINVIIFSTNNYPSKIKTIEVEEIEPKLLHKNIQIKTDDYHLIENTIDKKNTIYVLDNLKDFYLKLKKSRGTEDNYIRGIKYLIITYFPLILSYYFLSILNFPITYNLLTIIILKIYTIINSEYLLKNLPYDTDIMTRKPKPTNIFIGKQETIFLILESFCILFILNIPYMLAIVENGPEDFANSLFYTLFIMINILYTISIISDSNIIKNMFKSLKSISLIIYFILSIGLICLINFTNFLDTTSIGWHNCISCILFSLIAISINELIKLARFTTTKGRKK